MWTDTGRRIAPALLWIFLVCGTAPGQNVTPRPTALSVSNAPTPTRFPTPMRNIDIPVIRVLGARLEAQTATMAVFSRNTGSSGNTRLFFWPKGSDKVIDSMEDGLPGSVVLADDGSYMLFLHDEFDSGRDINGDLRTQTVLRMYHFGTGQKVNIGIPARSATPRADETRSQFEYSLEEHSLIYSSSSGPSNSQREPDAPWHIVNMLDVVYKIIGTPTPAHTPTPSPTYTPEGTATPTPSPSNTPLPTPIPTVPPGLRGPADINGDGFVNQLDLMLLRHFWRAD